MKPGRSDRETVVSRHYSILVANVLAALCVGSGVFAEPIIRDVSLNAQSVPRCDCLEISFRVSGDFANPFDPREIEVDGHFTRPDGKTTVMPGFLYQDGQRRLTDKGVEVVEKTGEPFWKVRFAPTVTGRWRVVIQARDRAGVGRSEPLAFAVTPSKSRGYVRRAKVSDYFCCDDGTPFFPVGENIAWAGRRGTFDFDDWLPAAGASGMNLARIWLQWNNALSIENKESGAGRYDLANAWRMDHVLDLARRSGVRVLFTCDSPEPYQKEHRWLGKLTAKPWENCPHNAANGGPLKEPVEFYTTDEGHRLIRQRLRYIVARWGWDPNIFCWELWNELNVFPGWDKLVPEIARWHVEMAGVLRALDPNRHLVSTSFSNADGHEDIWRLQELDFVQSHVYGSKDMAKTLPDVTRRMKERYGRPHLIGEFGPPLRAEYMKLGELDPDGVFLRNAIWSTALGGGAGIALSWWWDNYIHPNHLYRVFTPLAKFCDGVPWTTAGFRPLDVTVGWAQSPPPRPPRDLAVDCDGGTPVAGTVTLDPNQPDIALGRFYLYGAAQKDQQKPVALALTRSQAGPLLLRIGRVWKLGILEVKLDGQAVLRQEFPAGPGKGPWVKSELDKRWNIWGVDYDKDIVIDVPAGKHTVELYNAGKDGINITRVTLPSYVTDDRPPLRCIGLAGKRLALVWIQNSGHTLASLVEKRTVASVEGAQIIIRGIPTGSCRIEWWDTKTGEIRTTRARAAKNGLTLALPPLSEDVACKIRW